MGDYLLELVATLTRKELEVLLALWQNRGGSAGELAGMLCVSEACVRFHLHNIYRKLNVGGKVELLLFCQDIGLDQLAETWSRSRNKCMINGLGPDAVLGKTAQE